jgi:hypothetical protein
MNYHRELLFWGLALITGGAVALAAQQGYIDSHALAGAWRLWPLILIAIGISILASRTPFAIVGTIVAALVVGGAGGALIAVGPASFKCGGSDPTNLTTRQGTFADSASVKLDFNCGALRVAVDNPRLAVSHAWTVESGQNGGSPARITSASDRLEVSTSNDTNWFDQGHQRWNVILPAATSYSLEISPNAADSKVDLGGGTFTSVSIHPNAGSVSFNATGARIDTLDLSLNAGSASIVVGQGAADISGALSVNAGSIELCTAGAVVWRFTVEQNITFSTNLAELGFGHDGNVWSYSPPLAPGTVYSSLDLHITGNAGSFTLNPQGGCS